MMIYIPGSVNGSHCEGIADYEASRPPRSDAFIALSWFFLVLSLTLWSLSAIGFIYLRNNVRFRVVRPLGLQLSLCLAHILFAIGLLLNLAIPNLPCWVLVSFLVLGFATFGTNYFTRLIVYVVRSQYALLMAEKNKQIRIANDQHSDATSVTTSSSGMGKLSIASAASVLHSLVTLIKMSLGLTALDQIGFDELYTQRHSLWLVGVIVYTPCVIVFIVLFALYPQYSECYGCSIYLGLFSAFMAGLLFYIIASARMLYVAAFKLKFASDATGSFREFLLILLCVNPLMLLACLLLLFDPSDAEFEHLFAFEWLLAISSYVYWWIAAGSQFLHVYLARRKRPDSLVEDQEEGTPEDKEIISDYLQVVSANEEIKAKFEQFTIGRYAAENLYFINDVTAFKRFFFEKAVNWRKQKATFLYETYLKPMAAMEVNISHLMRAQTIKEVEECVQAGAEGKESTTPLFNVFDKAVDEITMNVLREIFQDFRRENRALVTAARTQKTVSLPQSATPSPRTSNLTVSTTTSRTSLLTGKRPSNLSSFATGNGSNNLPTPTGRKSNLGNNANPDGAKRSLSIYANPQLSAIIARVLPIGSDLSQHKEEEPESQPV